MFNKIADIHKKPEISTAKAKQSSQGSNFSQYLSSAMEPNSSPVSGTSSICVPNAIFATQMVNDEETFERRKKAVKRGFTLIEKLEEIRESILLDNMTTEKLIDISRFVKRAYDSTDDDRVNEIIAEIELRVEVELAKLSMVL